jgi:hypothetical protein
MLLEPQHTLPLGHVSAVHAMTTPTPPSPPHAVALSTHIISLQQTWGGLQTAAPHGTGPPCTTMPPPSGEIALPLLDPEPEELPLPVPPPSPVTAVVEPPHAMASASPVPSDTAITILIRMKASLPVAVIPPKGARTLQAGRRLFGPYVARRLAIGSRTRCLTIVARGVPVRGP